MKTIRRRAASPVLSWPSPGPDHEVRVSVRNQDTGERRVVYNGFRDECRLPPEFRLTGDQLAVRVMTRRIGEEAERFALHRPYTPIPRLGDDYGTPAEDLVAADPMPGADAYRLLVRHPVTDRPLVELWRDEPRFLLPVGQLRDGVFAYELAGRVRGRWRRLARETVTPAMIAAADARAARLVPLPARASPKVQGEAASEPPGRAAALAEAALPLDAQLLVAIPVTAAPQLSRLADPSTVASQQWWAGDGSAAVERVALALEARGLTGLFLLDVLAETALGQAPLAALAGALKARGHGLGLLINADPWAELSADLAALSDEALVGHALDRFAAIAGGAPAVVSFAPDLLSDAMLKQARAHGVRVVLTDREAQEALPAWMRWRTAPFAAMDGLVVIPATVALSTPAHVLDRAVRHPLSAADPLVAATARDLLSALARTAGAPLVVARIDPLSLLRRAISASAADAHAWNRAINDAFPRWVEAGWERNPNGFAVLAEPDEIKSEMMDNLLDGLAAAGVSQADVDAVLSPSGLRALCEAAGAVEPIVEQRRGPRVLRPSAVRRYDAAYLQALRTSRE